LLVESFGFGDLVD